MTQQTDLAIAALKELEPAEYFILVTFPRPERKNSEVVSGLSQDLIAHLLRMIANSLDSR